MNTGMVVVVGVLIAIPVIDLGVKRLLHRRLGSRTVPLGRLGHVRLLAQRIWLARLAARGARHAGGPNLVAMWALWLLAAAPLMMVGIERPSSAAFVGLLLGGSLSNALESSVRGVVSDYVCLRFWPAFNLADAALTVGAIGIAAQLLRI